MRPVLVTPFTPALRAALIAWSKDVSAAVVASADAASVAVRAAKVSCNAEAWLMWATMLPNLSTTGAWTDERDMAIARM